ncbi:DUF5696 domain-containing protein [Allofournierella sp.]|uniref:DUF5696 domain-containing protein n=1 Tax=Allofournierella sp. TaxID=1940256 RepID=UPI003AB136BD
MENKTSHCTFPRLHMDVTLEHPEERLRITCEAGTWAWAETYKPHFRIGHGELIYFSEAREIVHETYENGVGAGIASTYKGFSGSGDAARFCFQTLIWIEACTGDVHLEWIPLAESRSVTAVYWPGPMEFEAARSDWYTLLNLRQGLLLPNDWPHPLEGIPFNGLFGTAASYMPWFAQVRQGQGYMLICETPANAGYEAEHPAGGGWTRVGIRLENSLGRMAGRRSLRYRFFRRCDHNTICKAYRQYAKERGLLVTLEEKAVRLPGVRQLAGCSFLHKGIKRHIRPDSSFFDPKQPQDNDRLIRFRERAGEISRLHRLGAGRLLLHLDGWAQPGYDNCHPDYLPVCGEAGGAHGLKALCETLHGYGDLLALHDQYRDYYHKAPSFQREYSCVGPDGTYPGHSHWAGGAQDYLCTTQAPYYLRRNIKALREQGVAPDCSYLDVFTCNEGDECANLLHPMTREESYRWRCRCFSYLMANGLIPGSEEVNEWAVPTLVFCHYAPYEHMMRPPEAAPLGLPAPLFNLVYHDCVIEPWMMDRFSQKNDHMLYALLNGGAPYLERDPAYDNIDGAFSVGTPLTLRQKIERCRPVAALHERVAFQEMVSHEFVEGRANLQRTTFADGTTVLIDTAKGVWEIGKAQA